MLSGAFYNTVKKYLLALPGGQTCNGNTFNFLSNYFIILTFLYGKLSLVILSYAPKTNISVMSDHTMPCQLCHLATDKTKVSPDWLVRLYLVTYLHHKHVTLDAR